ncbi:hypothetical protein TorRG33x02_031200, partial [Trema orientale]
RGGKMGLDELEKGEQARSNQPAKKINRSRPGLVGLLGGPRSGPAKTGQPAPAHARPLFLQQQGPRILGPKTQVGSSQPVGPGFPSLPLHLRSRLGSAQAFI